MKRITLVELLEKTFAVDDDLKFEIGKLFGDPLLVIKNQKGHSECFGIGYQEPKIYIVNDTINHETFIGNENAILQYAQNRFKNEDKDWIDDHHWELKRNGITDEVRTFQGAIKFLSLKYIEVTEIKEDVIKSLNTDKLVTIKKEEE